MKAKLLFLLVFFSSILKVVAGESVPLPKMIFEENKNQWPRQVMFEADFGGGKLFLEKKAFTYLLIENINFHDFNKNSKEAVNVHYHSFKVNFQNSNPDVAITGNELYSFHRNYFIGNDRSKWAADVRLYEGVSYKNLYPSIDMHVYNVAQNLKYDLIVNPGGDPRNIQFKYDGADRMHIESGNLYIKTSLGDVIEQKPYAYQIIDGVKKEISCSYRLKNNTISFSVNGKYNKELALIIDPTLIASTYTGSFADNWGFTATYDEQGNIYSAGIVASAGYPTTIGAFDSSFNGGLPWTSNTYPFDISITKYNSTGSAILYSTYYGGINNEQPHSLFVNSNNELYLTGRTNSPNFPCTAGAFDTSYNGGYDIIVGKFSPTGALLASTFVGGTGDDGVNISPFESVFGTLKFNYADDGRSEIILDANSNVYVAGSTRSADFPTSSGAYDNSLGGAQDGCIFKMNSSLSSLTFSTYLGGSSDDAAYGLKLDAGNNIYTTGGTASTDFPTTAGVLYPTFQGGQADAYVAAINSTGTSLLYSTYLGTSDYDQAYLIETDANNDIYVYGQTKGAYPVSPGVYSNPNSGQFIQKMNKQLSTSVFSTVIGTGTPNPNISPTAFLVDSCQSIYIAGWARCGNGVFGHPFPSSVVGMPITANAFQSTTDGCDFYFMVLRPNAQSLLYATFFGESGTWIPDHVDGGTSRFDKRGFIYQSACASCGKTEMFPTTPTAWSKTNNSNNCNNAVIKMDLQVKPKAIAGQSGPPYGCVPLTMQFNKTGSEGTNFLWDFGDGSPTTTVVSPAHTYTVVGRYKASLYVTDSTGTCGKVDTATVIINVSSPPSLVTTSTKVLCNGGNTGSATVTVTGTGSPYMYLWSNAQTGMTATNLSASNYSVTVTDAYGCSSTAIALVSQSIPLSVNTAFTAVKCFGGTTGTVSSTVTGGISPYNYLWMPGNHTSTSVSGLSAGSYTLNVTDSAGCTVSSLETVTQPNALDITSNTIGASCGQSNGSANVSGVGGVAPYSWAWAGGQTGASISNVLAGSYTVTLTDANLCTATNSVSIAAIAGPTAAISSFTNVLCNGQNNGTATVAASGGTPPFTYLWNNGQTNLTALNLAIGTYSVTVTDSRNCSSVTSVSITQPSPLTASAIGINPTCFQYSNGSLSATVSGGTSPYSYLWTTAGTQTTAAVSNVVSGNYTVTVTDFNGCIKNASTALVDPNPISVSTTKIDALCNGACNGTATVIATNGVSPYSYLWSDSLHQTTAVATGLCAGSYSITVKDADACTAGGGVLIMEPSAVSVLVSPPQNLCYGHTVQINAQGTGGTPSYAYTWLGTSGLGLVGAGPHTVAPNQSTIYSVSVADANGCSSTIANILVVVPPALSVTVNSDLGICAGHSGILTATPGGGTGGPYTYSWSNGVTTQSQSVTPPSGVSFVNYVVTLKDGCSKPVTDTAVVIVYPLSTGQFTESSIKGCEPLTVNFNATSNNGVTYTWDFGDATSGSGASATHTYSKDGVYTALLTITTSQGCVTSITNTNHIKVYPLPHADFEAKRASFSSLYTLMNFTDLSTASISSWLWNFHDSASSSTISTVQNPIHSFSEVGFYNVELIVMNQFGCIDSTDQLIEIKDDFEFYAPNTFTPDGDGLNEVFLPVGVGYDLNSFQLFVFDRWGELIFQSNDHTKGWNGKAKNGPDIAPIGVYVWKVDLTDNRNNKHEYIGQVNLVK